jgi:transcription elongation factor GreA
MSGKVPMTPAGLQTLKEELRTLKTIERPRISKEIEVARGHGDLRENSEYHAAKEKQAHIEARIRLIDDWLANAEVIDVTKLKGEQVVFGATVVLLDLETEKEVRYRIVGEVEADLKKRHLSVTSPLARAVIGKKVGDVAVVQSPSGSREYELRRIEFEGTD